MKLQINLHMMYYCCYCLLFILYITFWLDVQEKNVDSEEILDSEDDQPSHKQVC